MEEENDLDASPAVKPVFARIMSLVTEEDEAVGKSGLRLLHMLAAFAVVGLNIAGQWSGGDAYTRPVSAACAALGGITFFVFCMMVTQPTTQRQPLSARPLRHSPVADTDCLSCACVCVAMAERRQRRGHS